MEEVFLSFEGTGRDGKVAVGTYISDAGKRFGLRDDFACDPEAHICEVHVISGSDLLSEITAFEKDYFPERKLGGHYRLGCHTKLERPGEVVVMSASGNEINETSDDEVSSGDEKVQGKDNIDADAEYQKHFADLPLEKKVAELVRLEAITFSETIGFIMNSPFSAAGKLMDVLAEFGFKKEADQRASMRPDEHKQSKEDQKESQTADDTSSASNDETEERPAEDM